MPLGEETMFGKRPTSKNARRGVTAAEFAVVSPFLFILVFACLELGLANMMFHTTEAAAYEGARTAIVPGATSQEAVAAVRAVLATAGIRVAEVSVSPADLSQTTQNVTVTVTTRFKDNLPLGTFFVDNDPMVKSCVLQRERLN